jgi:Uma2 family endonuclease
MPERQVSLDSFDGEYQVQQFREHDRIESPTFPELNLTAEQIFQAQR